MMQIEYSFRADGLYNKWVYMPTPKSMLEQPDYVRFMKMRYGWRHPMSWVLVDVVDEVPA